MAVTEWGFATIKGVRLENLRASPGFEGIVATIRSEMKVLCCHRDPCRDDLRFRRMVYTVEVSAPTFDWFFNSSKGYRAAYCESPHKGLKANELLLRNVWPALAASPLSASCGEEAAFIEDSLTSGSAKAWLTEAGKGFREERAECVHCQGQWKATGVVSGEILNGRWGPGNSYQDAGSAAPQLSQIKFMGGFLNERNDEFIPWDKRRRAMHIWEQGWS